LIRQYPKLLRPGEEGALDGQRGEQGQGGGGEGLMRFFQAGEFGIDVAAGGAGLQVGKDEAAAT
jgi:hypothetical protein